MEGKQYQIKTDIDPSIYRGYDIRGLVDEQLDEDAYYTFGRALATLLTRKRVHQTQVGHDVRLSSKRFAQAIIAGLNDGGINTIDLGETLTQVTYYSVYRFTNKSAVMITASHNPKEFNGLKVSTGYSETFQTQEIQDFKDLVASGDFIEPEKCGVNMGYDIKSDYIEDIIKRIRLKKRWRVVVDGCNGGAGRLCAEIFRKAGCEVVEQNTEPDGNFPLGAPDPTEVDALERLGEGVRSSGADIGFAFDADGDRMAVVDEHGQPLFMDMTIAILAKDILRSIPGATIVYNTLCSRVVPEVIEQAGGQSVIWLTGHAFIKKKAAEVGAPFSGELSGHTFFSDNFYGHDDGANASLRLLKALERSEQTLGEAMAGLPRYISSPEIKLGMADNIKFQFINTVIQDAFRSKWPGGEFTTIDGVRVDLPDRMAIVRASQNGPYITVKFEGKTEEVYNEVKETLSDMLHSHSEISWDTGVNIDALG